MDEPYRILVIDDDIDMCELLSEILGDEGMQVRAFSDSLEACKVLKKEEFDVIVTDLKMKGLKGLDILAEANKMAPTTPVIIITAFGTVESAIKAMKMGAYDYVTKPFQAEAILLTVQKALENRLLKKEVARLKREVQSRYSFHHIIGKSAAMQNIYDLVERIVDSSHNVLITGESGTGKELVAKALHYSGCRKAKPFMAVNCAAIPEALLESELFGYKKGAFTDAKTDKRGLLFEAAAGTVFLDEITEMAPVLQAKLLRVIEEREVRPLGGTQAYPIDVRFIASSNRNMKDVINQGQFREDLYYRLKVIDIDIPPLRERKEDIPLLIRYFLDKYGQESKKSITDISEEALKTLMRYSWPGNVRELENVIQRGIALCQHGTIGPEDLPDFMSEGVNDDLVEKGLREKYTVDQLEKEYIRRVLIEVAGNKSRAAEMLGLDRKTLYRKLEDL